MEGGFILGMESGVMGVAWLAALIGGPEGCDFFLEGETLWVLRKGNQGGGCAAEIEAEAKAEEEEGV